MAFSSDQDSVVHPPMKEIVLQLISAELKSRRFFNTLQDLGLDDSWCQPHLDDLILACMGLYNLPDKTFDSFYDLINRHAQQIDPSDASVQKQARAVYARLITINRTRLNTHKKSRSKK